MINGLHPLIPVCFLGCHICSGSQSLFLRWHICSALDPFFSGGTSALAPNPFFSGGTSARALNPFSSGGTTALVPIPSSASESEVVPLAVDTLVDLGGLSGDMDVFNGAMSDLTSETRSVPPSSGPELPRFHISNY